VQVLEIIKSSKKEELKPHFDGWLQERFPDHFAQIGTLNTLKLKNAVRDVARALMGSIPQDIEIWCRKFLVPPQGVSDSKFIFGYDTDEGHVQGSIDVDQNLQQYIARYPNQWEIVQDSLSLWRSRGRHAAGYVISNEPIDEFIPTTQVSGIKVLSFSGPEAEAVGAIKMDFLVVNSLKDVQECLKLVQRRVFGRRPDDGIINSLLVPGVRIVLDKQGERQDIWSLPEEREVYQDMDDGKVETVFQFDSNAARQGLSHYKGIINSVSDLAIFTALDRPGPLNYFVTNPDTHSQKHNMLVEYSRRAKGLLGSPDVVKELDTLCADTKGIMVYQESLMKVYQYFTGCSGAESEAFRKKVGKKKKEELEHLYKDFMQRSADKTDEKTAQEVWNSIVTWAEYGFNKSHSFGYCKLAYSCLWLKHHYPLEWWCAVLRNATKDEINDKFWQHCSHLVLLPDISLSKGTWEIEGDKIRAPVSMLYGIGETAHEQLAVSAPYADLNAFCQSIIDWKKKHATIKEEVAEDGTTNKVKSWGRNSLDIGKIQSIMLAGCMDSLFEPETTLAEKLDKFHSVMKELHTAEGVKYSKSKKKMPTLDILGRYQAKKDVLPTYGEDLRPLLKIIGLPEFLEESEGRYRIRSQIWSKDSRSEESTFDPVIGSQQMAELEACEDFVGRGVRCGIVAYIEDKESFNWGPNKSKTAVKLFTEFGGMKKEFVVWPDRNDLIPEYCSDIIPGSIVALVVQKSAGRSDFAVRHIYTIRKPLEKEEKKDVKKEEKRP
jgi:DNA polymerase III alpha subunit